MKTKMGWVVMLAFVLCSARGMAQSENMPVVSPEMLNVLYAGIENPVQIAIPGVLPDRIRVGVSNGTISGKDGYYIIRVSGQMSCILDISYLDDEGVTVKAGEKHFRIKHLPEPVIIIGPGYRDHSYISRNELLEHASLGIEVDVPFDYTHYILSFSMRATKGRKQIVLAATGRSFTQEMKNLIQKLDSGCMVYFEEIKVKGPAGSVRLMAPVQVMVVD